MSRHKLIVFIELALSLWVVLMPINFRLKFSSITILILNDCRNYMNLH